MKRCHDMPFGAQYADGKTRFQLWAPSARFVELCVEGEQPFAVAMARRENGWFHSIRDVPPETPYLFKIDGELRVPDPASRRQVEDVHGPSEVIDPSGFFWNDTDWRGRSWEEVVLYELHVGSFSPEGTFEGVRRRLDHLADLGITAIELMPIADFPGARNWGYDGVLLFAPDARYGRPEDLKRLVRDAHARGLMIFLDVVYNHFGPEGNYLHRYAAPFFDDQRHTPWGAAIQYHGDPTVREFFIHNALYWLEEYHVDGLRLDAVHAIFDESTPDILVELARRVAAGPGRERQVHLVLENDHNASRYLKSGDYAAQWNDDWHHAMHAALTGDASGYYMDYADDSLKHLGTCLIEGFAYQGQASPFRKGAARGESTLGISLGAFVNFLQNHDQIGNRAFGERLLGLTSEAAWHAATAILLLAPSPPLLFMGQEWAAAAPFLFFCDFGAELAQAVTQGRRREFARFPEFRDPQAQRRIPDPNDPSTYARSKLDWNEPQREPHRTWLARHRELLSLRRSEIAPRIGGVTVHSGQFDLLGDRALCVRWTLNDGTRLVLLANLSDDPVADPPEISGRLLYASQARDAQVLPPWSAAWYLVPSG